MNDKKITWITIGVVAVYLCLLIAWHFYDPTASFTELQPGADHRPARLSHPLQRKTDCEKGCLCRCRCNKYVGTFCKQSIKINL